METGDLRKRFLCIKKLFFPTWDRVNAWKVSFRCKRLVHGICLAEAKRIEIGYLSSEANERDKLFIHEICHAVTPGGHGKRWLGRMEKAAVRADKLGMATLATLLRAEGASYQDSGGINSASLLDQAYDAVTFDPHLTYLQIKKWIAREGGMLLHEVDHDRTLRRGLKKVYLEGRKEGLAIRKEQEEVRRLFAPQTATG